ncbi:unnamed protein product [Closterium sp. NIES-54]
MLRKRWRVRDTLKYEWLIPGQVEEEEETDGGGGRTDGRNYATCGDSWARFDPERFCQIIGGRNVLVVGDSSNMDLADSIWRNARMGAKDPAARVIREKATPYCQRLRKASKKPLQSRCWTVNLCSDLDSSYTAEDHNGSDGSVPGSDNHGEETNGPDSTSSLSQKGQKGGRGKREEEAGVNQERAAQADLQQRQQREEEGRERAIAASREGEGLRKMALRAVKGRSQEQPGGGGRQDLREEQQEVQQGRQQQQPARHGKQQQQLLLQQEDHTGRVTKARGRSEGREEEAGRKDGETGENTGKERLRERRRGGSRSEEREDEAGGRVGETMENAGKERLRERGRSSSRSRGDGDEDGIEGRDDERRVSDRSGRSKRKGSGAGAIGVEVNLGAKERGFSMGSASKVFRAEERAGGKSKSKGRMSGQRSLLSNGEEGEEVKRGEPIVAKPFQMHFIQDDSLSVNYSTTGAGAGNEWIVSKKFSESWMGEIAAQGVSIVVMNRGGHSIPGEQFERQMRSTLLALRQTYPDLLILFISSPAAHTNCWEHWAPVKEVTKSTLADGEKGDGREVQNGIAKGLVEMVGGVFVDLDYMTALRPDGHVGRDCTRNCQPGPVDTWSQVLYNMLLDLL